MRSVVLLTVWTLLCSPALSGENWPMFRGPWGDGHTDSAGLPVTWSETSNVVWKTPVHDRGWSSPVVWGNQVWMTTASADGKKSWALCVDKETGKIVHDVLVFQTPAPEKINAFNSYASPTPAIEAGRLYVHFGVYGTASLDTGSGKVLWERRDLPCDHFAGPGSSPVLVGDLLVLTMDGMSVQYLVALDKATGKTVWKTNRSTDFGTIDGDLRKAFSTPVVARHDGKRVLVAVGAGAAMGYEVDTGVELWKVCYKGGFSNSSQPVQAGELVLVNTGHGIARLLAVPVNGRGDLTAAGIKWRIESDVPLRSSPVIVGPHGYMTSDSGVLTCFETATGNKVFRQRLGGGNFSASPITDGRRIWLFDEKGTGTVIEVATEFKPVATSKLPDGCMGTPAVSGKSLYVRTKTALYRIQQP